MKSIVNQRITAGLLDNSFELFSQGDKQYCVAEGRRHDFPYFPLWVLNIIKDDMEKHPNKVDALKSAGVVGSIELTRWYIHCCFGGYDGNPDYVDGQLIHTEYFDCGQRGNCDIEGKACNSIIHQMSITQRQLQVIKLIHQGLQDKEIAEELQIKTTTASIHVKQTIKKLALGNRSDVVRFAGDHHIILNN